MTIINRALHKAYQRRAESGPALESQRPAAASVNGWASKLRDPIRLPEPAVSEHPVLEQSVSEQSASEMTVTQKPLADEQPTLTTVAGPTSPARSPEPNREVIGLDATLPAGTKIRVDAGHSATPEGAPTPFTSAPVDERAATSPQIVEQWSWPPIVQRLLTCPAASELRDLATQLRSLAAGSDLRCIAFSGPGRHVGRTSLVLTLASVLIADKSTRVVIVDADFNHPDAAQLISLNPACGLEEAMNQAGADESAATTLIAGRLAIVPLVKSVAAAYLDRRRLGILQTFLRSLRRAYDVVLIDAGPWEPGRPPLLLECRAVDAVVSVCRAKSSGEVPADASNFSQPGVEWLGVIETFSN